VVYFLIDNSGLPIEKEEQPVAGAVKGYIAFAGQPGHHHFE